KNVRKIEIASGYLFGATTYWYDNIKSTITSWFDAEDISFHNELHNIEQRKSEYVPEYVIKFKRLKKKVDPKDKLLDDYVVRLFLSGFRQEIAMYIVIKDPQILEKAIKVAEKAGAGKYYGKSNSDDGKAQPLSTKDATISLNYVSLISTIVTQDEYHAKRPTLDQACELKAPKTVDAIDYSSDEEQESYKVGPHNSKRRLSYSRNPEEKVKIKETAVSNRSKRIVVQTTHLDNQLLLVDENKELDNLNDLIEELKFEKEERVYKYKMYYSEGWELKNENEVMHEVHIEDDSALLEINKDAFAEKIAEEGQTLKLGYTTLTYHEINT
ncbi:1775_t:CDS:2, partial [Gigaspora rosea]